MTLTNREHKEQALRNADAGAKQVTQCVQSARRMVTKTDDYVGQSWVADIVVRLDFVSALIDAARQHRDAEVATLLAETAAEQARETTKLFHNYLNESHRYPAFVEKS